MEQVEDAGERGAVAVKNVGQMGRDERKGGDGKKWRVADSAKGEEGEDAEIGRAHV